MRTTVQQKHADGTIATLLRTALANRHDGNTKAEAGGGGMSQQLLNPPKPPTLHETGCLLLASSGFYIRLHEDGSASLVDGIQDITLAEFTPAEIEGIAYNLSNEIGATR